jgi:hypothetical protein
MMHDGIPDALFDILTGEASYSVQRDSCEGCLTSGGE